MKSEHSVFFFFMFSFSFFLFFFFFKQKTAYEIYQCDWSSDVCSSDLTINSIFKFLGFRRILLLRFFTERVESASVTNIKNRKNQG